jgi:hypothetical protein
LFQKYRKFASLLIVETENPFGMAKTNYVHNSVCTKVKHKTP